MSNQLTNKKLINTIKINNITNNDVRIDKFLVETLNINRSHVQKLIKQDLVYLNHQVVTKTGTKIYLNDQIDLYEQINEEKIETKSDFKLDLKIYYEDNDLLILYKPSGLLVHETNYHENETLFNALKNYSKNQWTPYLVHRLDKDTSGLIMVAKNELMQQKLLALFIDRKIIKKYYALVENNYDKKHFFIDVAIGRSNDNKLKMVAGEGKNLKPSLSEVNVLEQFNGYSLIEIILHTGRTHQIRVHLNYINHPVVNDPLYNAHKANSSYHQYLMAYYLKFTHPITKKEIEIKIDLDKEFKDFINQLENNN